MRGVQCNGFILSIDVPALVYSPLLFSYDIYIVVTSKHLIVIRLLKVCERATTG